MKKREFLGPRETFEVYEKRAHSPLNNARAPSPPGVAPSPYAPTPTPIYLPAADTKRKVPLPFIIGLAVTVPVFVILMLFLAIWLQEMGII
uniref:Small membrane protein n=1 Tax=Globodera pallida TaxID=36090 RepID=A0A183CNQ2_GLOPA